MKLKEPIIKELVEKSWESIEEEEGISGIFKENPQKEITITNQTINGAIFNGIDFNSNYSYPFLRTQYLFRKYGFNNMSKIKLFKKYLDEARNLSNIFLINSKEQLYDSIAFDFKLISSLPKLEDNLKLIYDECLNNYKLFASLNYFKLEYPDIFNDKSFLKFVRDITESQSIENHELNNENCLFADFYVENRKTLNYVNRGLKRL